jgi:hypothetical protein
VPRFFFHIHDCLTWDDEVGEDLRDAAMARSWAMARARRLVADRPSRPLDTDHGIMVADNDGRALFKVTFQEAVLQTLPSRGAVDIRASRPRRSGH